MARKYDLNKRAKKLEETRRRIVDATVALHTEVGPARTSISAIAERAGVERLTVYRHFPEEREIFLACSNRFNEQHPLPDPSPWLAIDDPAERLARALRDLYGYYASAEQMLSNVLRDAPLMPAISDALARGHKRRESLAEVIVAGWALQNDAVSSRLSVAVKLAFDFNTWHLLVRIQQLPIDDAVDLMVSMVTCIANGLTGPQEPDCQASLAERSSAI